MGKTLRTIYILGFTLLVASCKESFLDLKPKGRVIVESTNDYDLMLNAAGLATNGVNVSVPMGDEVIAFDDYFSSSDTRGQRLFKWDDVIYDEGIFANEMSTLMANLYTYNKVITEVMDATDGTEAQKKSLLAEAKANRAWTNFMLINMYGKPYQAATAATDPGYPIVTVADVTQTKFTRASVQEMYDFIIKDLTEAIPDLPVTIRTRARMGKTAVEELLGKVYVFMGRFELARTLLDAAVTDLAGTGAGTTLTNMGLYDLNVTMIQGGTWGYNPTVVASTYFNAVPNQGYYTEYIACRQVSTNGWSFNASEFTLSPQAAQLFSSTDKRRNFFTTRPYGVTTAYPLAGALRRNGPLSLQNGITIAELYLLRAECAARLNDTTTAKADLLTLRVKRMSSAEAVVPSGLTQIQLIQFVLDERIREFALQGYRWFDMRRLSVDPLFSSATYTHSLYSATGALSATFTLRPERFTLRFPEAVMALNPGMENNP
ncbi:RagB/SusD family nutrient uptake outer membrane protein [Chitinophaga tropicalis]|uniref:RagB/SusD family nutrient uptake outer membrane protein n=1 Tax=Chitinophaga tropicalis TaxID=2683588 RepID=A0A7K1U5G6_9BACT|nr:RagB/SusD family nutrient uptake outer membrane protein [Chitinophaga tropicalis]MVT09603.1 RagB/SusD family nutrient uptake outer membrane protein [Chitinophaga tropicalis]